MVARRAHFGDDARAHGGIHQPLAPFLVAAGLHPRRHRGVESRRAGGVGVHVGGDAHSCRARGVDAIDDRVHLRPVRAAGRLEVVDLRGDARLAGDAHQLVDPFQQAIPFAAHMGDVHAAVRLRRLAQLDQLLGGGIRAGGVDERRSHAERAVAHGPADHGAHLLELVRSGRTVRAAEDVDARRRRAEERADVDRDAAADQRVEIFAERGPVDVVLDVALEVEDLLLHGRRERSHRLAFAEDLRGHALLDVRHRAAVGDERFLRLAHDVDEARRRGEAVRVDFRAAAPIDGADGGDAVAADGHVAAQRFTGAAVVDDRIADDGVVRPDGGAGAEGEERGCQNSFHSAMLSSPVACIPRSTASVPSRSPPSA